MIDEARVDAKTLLLSPTPRDEVGDALKELAQSLRIEPRWPIALTVLALLLLLTVLPGRVRVFPIWVPDVLGTALIVPIAVITLTTKKARWLRIERTITLLFFIAVEGGTLVNLTRLIAAMVDRSGKIGGIQLLTSSIAMWVINVFTFSLLYWQIDRGGPEARSNNVSARPDWLFPEEGARENVPPDWRPTFVDYLFLGYSTATAFSSTDTLPLTSRAKVLMMFESAFSLVTIVIVASRAINILGS
jgi:hypothetical protein